MFKNIFFLNLFSVYIGILILICVWWYFKYGLLNVFKKSFYFLWDFIFVEERGS